MADRILCSCVTCPKCGAWVDVEREVADLTAAIFSQAPDPEAVRRERIAVHPIGRLGHPKDMTGLAVYLASDESAWVTGAGLPIDGGHLSI